MKQERRIYFPHIDTRSTFLVPEYFYDVYIKAGKIGKIGVAFYLHQLLNDSNLEYKLSFLKPRRWKMHYQQKGQDLHRVNFYPHELDWAHLSAISSATGFSRCYIFVFLMLLQLGVTRLDDGGTPPVRIPRKWNPLTLCSILVDSRLRILTRVLQT